MKTLLEGFRGYLKEIKNRYEFVVFVRMEHDLNLYADLFEKIRAIPGVTIVKTGEKQKDISPTQKAAVLEIKCIVGVGADSTINDRLLFSTGINCRPKNNDISTDIKPHQHNNHAP